VPFNSGANKIDQDQATPATSLASQLTKEQYAEARTRADRFVAATGPLTAE